MKGISTCFLGTNKSQVQSIKHNQNNFFISGNKTYGETERQASRQEAVSCCTLMHYITRKRKHYLSICYSVVTTISITRFTTTTSLPRPQGHESSLLS